MIHTTQVTELAMQRDENNDQVPFSLRFVDKQGDITPIDECVCTSASFRNKTINVRIISSEEIRTIRTITIVEFNDQEVYR